MTTCGARIEIPNGETVTPCDLAPGHEGRHYGWCLGSRFVWADEDTEPETFTEALAELLGDMEDAQRREYVETNIEVDTVAALVREVQQHRTQAREEASIRADERERCAKVADAEAQGWTLGANSAAARSEFASTNDMNRRAAAVRDAARAIRARKG